MKKNILNLCLGIIMLGTLSGTEADFPAKQPGGARYPAKHLPTPFAKEILCPPRQFPTHLPEHFLTPLQPTCRGHLRSPILGPTVDRQKKHRGVLFLPTKAREGKRYLLPSRKSRAETLRSVRISASNTIEIKGERLTL